MFHRYKNGNYTVMIDDVTGTKIRETEDDEFCAEFPESMDINLTQRCTGSCPYCYAECTPDGKHGDIMGAKFVDTLKPYTEVALQINDMSHDMLIPFLEKLKALKVFPSITVNQMHFEQKEDFITDLIDRKLIYGVGISLRNATKDFTDRVHKYPNAVIHTIYGVTSFKDYYRLANNNMKVLILGYKDKGRGHNYLLANRENIERQQKWLYDNIMQILELGWYKVLSFDNLALEQLNLKERMPKDKWEAFYMGDDGTSSFYVDLVNGTFGKSSLVPKEEMLPLKDDVVEMFEIVRGL